MSGFWKWPKRWWRWVKELIRRILEWIAQNSGGGGPVEDIPACCGLAVPEKECNWVGSRSNFTCPEGFHPTYWTCVEGSQVIACGECSSSAESCYGGPWDCSIWWKVG